MKERKEYMTKKEKKEGDDRRSDNKAEVETEKMRKIKEALKEIDALKVELQEVNLLNAKLLYTNKIFRNKNLNEDKKVKVLKAFDKASTVKEAKIIFETLNEGISEKKFKQTSRINEIKGSASKSTGTASVQKQPIVESDAMVERFKRLAGII